ncbi:MAG: hypothetical protein ACK5MT_07585 [Actinomycetales bacterium]
MSYAWRLYLVDPDAVLAELRSPTLNWDDVGDLELAEEIADEDDWPDLQADVAGQLRDAGDEVELDGDGGDYLWLVVNALAGDPVVEAEYSSGAGDWFRDQVLGALTPAIGADSVTHLVERALGPIRPVPFPVHGWLNTDEVQTAVAGLNATGPIIVDDDNEDTESPAEDVEQIVHALRQATSGVFTITA